MNPTEIEIIARFKATVALILQGALTDARELLAKIDLTDGAPFSDLVEALSHLTERLAESLSSKESALATVQLSMLELEAAQEELQTKEARYRDLFANMSDGVSVYEAVDGGQDFAFKDINNAALQIERLRREEVVGRRVTEVFPGVAEFGLLEMLRRVHNTGAPEHLAARFYQDYRISGWRENFVYRLPTKEVVAVYRDVSAQKAADQALQSALKATGQIIDAAPFALVVVAKDLTIRRANEAAGKILDAKPSELVGQSWSKFVAGASNGVSRKAAEEAVVVDAKGSTVSVLLSVIPATIGDVEVLIEAFLDLTDRKQLETKLRHAQKLEAVGQLAAGIAHEINTPMQYVGDNTRFLQDTFNDLSRILKNHMRLIEAYREGGPYPDMVSDLEAAGREVDLGYLLEEIPKAITQSLEGVAHVATIVHAMKEFAHPDLREKSLSDLNRALQATLTITRNEYKYVADVETEFGELPPVLCHASDMNQVFLNLIINAAHAIADRVGQSGGKGRIRVRTANKGDRVRIDIADTGSGIPAGIRERIFEPFFTTKEVGRGSGQGLAIARNIVVDKHHGSLTFESEVDRGTTFTILLPVNETAKAPVGAAS